ncbi:hypothetical protein [Aquabacterium sp. J223]|uniref:hypothetical protein n=1 Tax=Aquabacterium sp. J223 TaxID=2898431 RepID=UPI0021ADE5C2|nr:hypothetical protein [Aquabacterium sp. J223]UUX95781.1 hypothetical protein LRS07_21765 [Aquabacterium sp. J223]
MRLLIGSCRYQASGFEQQHADRVLARIVLQAPDAQNATLLDGLDAALLLGDLVYADATYGLMDTPHRRPAARPIRRPVVRLRRRPRQPGADLAVRGRPRDPRRLVQWTAQRA